MKCCKKCNTQKEITEFYKDKCNRDGLHGSCKSCMNEVTRKWYAKNYKYKLGPQSKGVTKNGTLLGSNKNKRFRIYLEDKCRRCGFIPEDVCQLTIDHIDRNKKNNQQSNLQTLCANCHYLKTKLERKSPEKLKIYNLIP